jgi:hypothetical protein
VTPSDVLEAVERIAARDGDAADVLQAIVATIVEEGAPVGQLDVDGLDDQPLIEQVAALISPYCTNPENAS